MGEVGRMQWNFTSGQMETYLMPEAWHNNLTSMEHAHFHLNLPLVSGSSFTNFHCLCPIVSVQMSAVGITENVKGDIKKFEVWYNGREEVYIIQVCYWQQNERTFLNNQGSRWWLQWSPMQPVFTFCNQFFSFSHQGWSHTTQPNKKKNGKWQTILWLLVLFLQSI